MLFAALMSNLISKLASLSHSGHEVETMSARELADIGIDYDVRQTQASSSPLAGW
jgi:hypothetical protein